MMMTLPRLAEKQSVRVRFVEVKLVDGGVLHDAAEDGESTDDDVDDGINGDQVQGEADDGSHVAGVPQVSSISIRQISKKKAQPKLISQLDWLFLRN